MGRSWADYRIRLRLAARELGRSLRRELRLTPTSLQFATEPAASAGAEMLIEVRSSAVADNGRLFIG